MDLKEKENSGSPTVQEAHGSLTVQVVNGSSTDQVVSGSQAAQVVSEGVTEDTEFISQLTCGLNTVDAANATTKLTRSVRSLKARLLKKPQSSGQGGYSRTTSGGGRTEGEEKLCRSGIQHNVDQHVRTGNGSEEINSSEEPTAHNEQR
ncbi:hypothetical protein QTP88_029150 [Uroleucon formosanum]